MNELNLCLEDALAAEGSQHIFQAWVKLIQPVYNCLAFYFSFQSFCGVDLLNFSKIKFLYDMVNLCSKNC